MTLPDDVTAAPGFSDDLMAFDPMMDDDGVDTDQEINDRRAQAENPEALRLARAL